MRKTIVLALILAFSFAAPVFAANCNASATNEGCDAACSVTGTTVTCQDGDNFARCTSWDAEGLKIEDKLVSCYGAGGPDSGGASGPETCDFTIPFWWLFCDPFLIY